MKKILSFIITAASLIGAGLCTFSCIDDGFENPSYGNGGYHPGGGNNQGGNNQGGNTGGDKETSVFPGDLDFKLKAKASYFGDGVYKGVDNYVLYLYWGEYDNNGDFKSKGTELAIDLLCPISDKMEIAVGTYQCTSDDLTKFHFLDGMEEDGVIYPSYAYYQTSPGKSKTVFITAGRLEVSKSNGDYNLRLYFTAEKPESNVSTSYLVQYNGPIEFTDNSGNQGGGIDKNIEMKGFSRALVENWGQIWEDSKGNKLPVNDWIIYLYGENADKDNEYAMVEILTDTGADAIVPGIYNDVIGLDDSKLFKSGAVIKGYTDDDNIAYGTWYCKDGTAYYAASKGQLSIASKDDLYSLTFDFIDEDETYGGSFKGSYTGELEYKDMTKATKSGVSRGMKMQKIQKNSVPSRTSRVAGRVK